MRSNVFEATRAKKVDLPFRCPCGLAKTTRISVIPLATSNAYALADAALDRIACPSCGRRIRDRDAWLRSAPVVGAAGLGCAGGLIVFAGLAVHHGVLGMLGSLVMLAGVLSFAFQRDRADRAWQAAESAVFFEPRSRHRTR